jgi:hypothetical protein
MRKVMFCYTCLLYSNLGEESKGFDGIGDWELGTRGTRETRETRGVKLFISYQGYGVGNSALTLGSN